MARKRTLQISFLREVTQMTPYTRVTRGAVLLALVAATPLLSSCYFTRLVTWPDEQNRLKNGSFEEGAFAPNQNNVMPVQPGNTAIKEWEVMVNKASSPDIVWLQNGNGFFITTPDGNRFLDLTGNETVLNGPFGGVRQFFQTATGFDYRVRFNVGVAMNFPGPVTVTVKWGTSADDENAKAQTCGPFDAKSGVAWNTCEHRFTATGAQTILTISGTSGTRYIGLDKVSVDCYAPLGVANLCNNGPFF